MFNRGKKTAEPKRKHDLSQFGLFDVPDLDNPDDLDDSGGDSDLEAELAAIAGDSNKSKAKAQKPKTVVPQSELDRMVAESLRDIGSDEELSGDEDDPDLLNELTEIAGDDAEATISSPVDVSPKMDTQPIVPDETILPTTTMNTVEILKSRIELYKIAEKQAKEAGEGTKARSRARGIKTLESMLKQALAGKTINADEIPPVVSIKGPNQPAAAAPAAPVPVSTITTPNEETPAPDASPPAEEVTPVPTSPIMPPAEKPSASVDETKINALLERQREYKLAALTAKKSGETATALQYVKIIKIFDTVIASARNGESVDLSDMPPHPNELSNDLLKSVGQSAPSQPADPPKQENAMQQAADEPKPIPAKIDLPPPDVPKTILEALTQRLQKYQATEANAKAEGNDRKARQNGRIVKQYLDAIKMHKAGKPIAFDELPTPPNYPPIPLNSNQRPARPPPSTASTSSTSVPSPTPSTSNEGQSAPEKTSPSRPPLKKQDSRISGNHSNTSVMNKTIELLLERQKEFKDAALEAKKAGELEQAKELLKTYKGIESLLNVARGGLPIDLSTVPISPKQREKLDDTFEMLSDPEEATISDDLKDIYARLEKQLTHQLEKCKAWSIHHRALGDVPGTNRFENLALSTQRDLDIIKLQHRKGSKVPKFHFEQKSFSIVRCNTDLAETEMEIEVVRGISYNVSKPKDVDTYVKLEFPYPQETPYRNKTAVIYDTENPEYNEKFVVEIQPKSRACQRAFKRQGVKFEVFSKGGFFRSDALIGTATVKLQPLETTCEIHDSFELMDGRRSAGGKLEVKIRTRNPILAKQVVTETEKWLVLQ